MNTAPVDNKLPWLSNSSYKLKCMQLRKFQCFDLATLYKYKISLAEF